MSTNLIDDGGPAYPTAQNATLVDGKMTFDTVPGMTLRDYFAGQAITGRVVETQYSVDVLAEWAYQLADALIKERNKQIP